MKAHEIQQEASAPPRLVAAGPHGNWYATTGSEVEAWYKKNYGAPSQSFEKDPQSEWFMFVLNKGRSWSLDDVPVQMTHDKRLIVGGNHGFYDQNDVADVQALLDATGAQSGRRLWGNVVVYNGQAYYKMDVFKSFAQVGKVGDSVVYEVPRDAWWVLNKLNLKYQVSSDRVVVFNPDHELPSAWVCVSIKNNQVTSVQSARNLSKDYKLKLSLAVSKALGLGQAETTEHYLIPNTKMHRVLKAIADNPGVKRWPLYLNILKLKKVPTYKGNEDVASRMVDLGLAIKQDHGEHGEPTVAYTLNARGKMVLAALEAGKRVPMSSMVKA